MAAIDRAEVGQNNQGITLFERLELSLIEKFDIEAAKDVVGMLKAQELPWLALENAPNDDSILGTAKRIWMNPYLFA